MNKYYFKKTLIVLAILIVGFAAFSRVVASVPAKCGVFGPSSGVAGVVCADGYETAQCAALVSNRITGVTEDRSFFVSLPWIGGQTFWDDKVALYGLINDVIMIQANGLIFGNANCGSGVQPGQGNVGAYYFFTNSPTDTDSYQFQINALQGRDVGSSGNTFWGQAEYGFTQNYCSTGQFTLNGSCVNTAGTLGVGPAGSGQSNPSLTCNAPCSPEIHWTTTSGLGSSRILRDGVVINNSTDGDCVDNGGCTASSANFAVGPHSYTLQILDGYNAWNVRGSVTVDVVNATPTAEMSVSYNTSSEFDLVPSDKVGGGTISNINATNGGGFTVDCVVTTPFSGLTTIGSINCPSGTIASGASVAFSITLGSNTPAPPSTYNGEVTITAIPVGSTVVSSASHVVPVVYTVPVGPSGTLTPASTSCTVPLGQSNCSINFSWNTVNPISGITSVVTKTSNVNVANGNSGTNVPFVVPYPGTTYSLSHDGALLDEDTVTSSCASGTIRQGGQCVTSVGVGTDGACALAHYGCSSAGASTNNAQGASSWTWICPASGGGNDAFCSESIPTGCGSADGQSYPPGGGPTSNLCADGSAAAVYGAPGPWTWSCPNGGGPLASCSANVTSGGSCPAGAVILGPSSVGIGIDSYLSVPAGFSGGTFSSSNSAVAQILSTRARGQSAGTSSISGSGWSYTNGATNCPLIGQTLTVTAGPTGPSGAGGGACGKTYSSGATSFGTDLLCSVGTVASCSAGTAPNCTFPAPGSSVNWICNPPSPVATTTGGAQLVLSQSPPGYTIHKFISAGTFTPNASGSIEVIAIGGGGGGGGGQSGGNNSGGGGGGGLATGFPSVTAGTSYSITIGSGGTQNTNGSPSVFDTTISAIGGGYGGRTNGATGGNGGSGGGGAYTGAVSPGNGSQGWNGGWGSDGAAPGYGAGGGGGLGGDGGDGTDLQGGQGGLGRSIATLLNSGIGLLGTLGGGGGGGDNIGTDNYGQNGGGFGGAGSNGGNGVANMGGGGGGASSSGNSGGTGGSGIVIIEYLTPTTGSPSGQCTATRSAAPVIGVGGTACGKTYPFNANSFGSDTFCSSGTPSGSLPFPAFPAQGAIVSWTCLGSGGGSDSPLCTATHDTSSNFSLTVTKTGGGSVRSVDGNIDCGNRCSKSNYAFNASVTLQAIPDSSYWKFVNWTGGACSGSGSCILNLTVDRVVNAVFAPRTLDYNEF